jgi:hypothetical protein
MSTAHNLGIWMDHQVAHLIQPDHATTPTTIIRNNFNHGVKESAMQKSENLAHNKEQQEQTAYYKKLGEIIIQFDEVLLFGPTDAKTELHTMLKEDRRFDKVKFHVTAADKMTENQQHAFMRKHFSM